MHGETLKFVPQHVSGVFMLIIRRSNCVSLPMVLCPGCSCCDVGESGGKMCALCGECCLSGKSGKS